MQGKSEVVGGYTELSVTGDLLNLWLQDCVGAGRDWAMVFVDHMPMTRRGLDIMRLLPRSQLVVVHDTQDLSANFPSDFLTSLNMWAGRPCMTQIQMPSSGPVLVYTILIQGDLDTEGKVFSRAKQIVEGVGREIELIYESVNPDNESYGTHVKLLVAALLATTGDIIELGTGVYSTDLIHQIVEQQNNLASHNECTKPTPSRYIVSADASASWLTRSRHLSNNFHQLLLVPAYSNGMGCTTNSGRMLSTSMVPAEGEEGMWAGRRENIMWGDMSCKDLK